MKKIRLFTDGSCIGNPGPGGWAFILIDENEKIIKSSSEKIIHRSNYSLHTTNNRMEMQAILESLNYVSKNYSDYSIELFSDSNLLIQTLNLGWKRKSNLDLWKEIDEYRKNLSIKYIWVKGHADNEYNNLCDEYAQQESAKAAKLLSKNPQLATQAQEEFTILTSANTLKNTKNQSTLC